MSKFEIGNRTIGQDSPPFVIAEMSGNHNQSFDQACAIVRAAKRAGADAIKLQTFTADTITIPSRKTDFMIKDPDNLWHSQSLFQLYQKAELNWDWIERILQLCESLGLLCFSSVFDERAVDFLERLNVCAYKIASFENAHYPLIRRAALSGKPLIISTGLASEEELDGAVATAREAGCKQLVLLKCTSTYPAKAEESNLRTIPYLEERYQCLVGLSDHTLGNDVALASVALGARVIEKHLTVGNEGVDVAFSSQEEEFARLVQSVHSVHAALGRVSFDRSKREESSSQFRRSIYAVAPIRKGEPFTASNVRIIRPGYGLHPRYYERLLGCFAKKRYEAGDRIEAPALD